MNARILSVLLSLSLLFISLQNCGVDEPSNDNDGGVTWITPAQQGVDSTIYYVATSGNDENSGDAEHPFQTIAKALEHIKPGGEIRILPGEYHEHVGIEKLGATAAAIRLTGWQGRPVLHGQNKATMSLLLQKCKNIVIEKLTLQNYTDTGIMVTECTDITLRDLVVSENGHAAQLGDWEIEGYGIHVEDSRDVLIEENDVFRNGPDPQIFPERLMGTGIDTYGNHNCTIRNNHSHDNIGGGMLVEDSFDVLVEDNIIDGNDLDASKDEWWDGGLWVDGGARVTVQNNEFFNNKGPGIEISDEDKQKPSGYVLKNNKSHDNYFGIFIWNFGTNDWPAANIIAHSGNTFENNSRQDIWIVDWY